MCALGRQAAGPQPSQILRLGISLPAACVCAHARTHTHAKPTPITTQPLAAATPPGASKPWLFAHEDLIPTCFSALRKQKPMCFLSASVKGLHYIFSFPVRKGIPAGRNSSPGRGSVGNGRFVLDNTFWSDGKWHPASSAGSQGSGVRRPECLLWQGKKLG